MEEFDEKSIKFLLHAEEISEGILKGLYELNLDYNLVVYSLILSILKMCSLRDKKEEREDLLEKIIKYLQSDKSKIYISKYNSKQYE